MDREGQVGRYRREDLQVLWFVEAVCRRPQMYTLHGTLEEVWCFLNGVYSGMTMQNGGPQAQARVQRDWDGFIVWLSANLPDHPAPRWSEIYASLRQRHPEDQAAFSDLATLYRQYQQQDGDRPA